MNTKNNEFIINIEINGRRIILTHVVWNYKTSEYIGYDNDADNIVTCRIHPKHYDISITTNQAIPPYIEQ